MVKHKPGCLDANLNAFCANTLEQASKLVIEVEPANCITG